MGRRAGNSQRVVFVSAWRCLLHAGDDRRVRGSERGGIWRGADRHADAGLRPADIDGRVSNHGTDSDHLDTPPRPRLASGRLAALRDHGVYSAIGIGLGFYFIKMLDEHALRRSLGVFLILYSIYALATAKASRTVSARWRRPLAAGTGIAGGLLGTLFGAGVGPIYVVYFNSLRMEREIFRVTMTTVVLLGGAARIAGYASFGFYERSSIALVGLWVGSFSSAVSGCS